MNSVLHTAGSYLRSSGQIPARDQFLTELLRMKVSSDVSGQPRQLFSGVSEAPVRVRPWIALIGAILFTMAAKAHPLYWANQNTKFLHGLARAFPDRLGADWTANTIDGLPLFSAMVFAIARFSHPLAFHLVEFGLLAGLFYSCLFLAVRLSRTAGAWPCYQAGFAAILIILVSADAPFRFLDGVAEQYLSDFYLQPADMGIFFIAALALAIARRTSLAIIIAATPAAFHPGYIVLSLIVTASILAAAGVASRRFGFFLAIFVAAALIFVPQIDLALRFAWTDPETFRQATQILAFERIPHHSDPARWMGLEVFTKLVLAAVAIYLAPPGVMRIVLTALVVWAIAGFVAAVTTGSASLALIAPWRASVVIVPVSVIVILARLANAYADSSMGRYLKLASCAALILVASGAAVTGTKAKLDQYRASHQPPEYVSFVHANHHAGDVYLTDPFQDDFRLAAMTAQFVSWKTHPYLDREVIEWHRRILLAQAVFRDSQRNIAFDCAALAKLLKFYPVTHVLIKDAGKPQSVTCPLLELRFSGGGVRIFGVKLAQL